MHLILSVFSLYFSVVWLTHAEGESILFHLVFSFLWFEKLRYLKDWDNFMENLE